MKKNPFKLSRVAVRLVEEPPLLSMDQLDKPEKVVDALADELKQYDREVIAIIHLTTDCKPINMTIASMGQLNGALASTRDLMKAAILSNAAGIVMLHNHVSGNLTPSSADIRTTDRLKLVCDLLDIPLIDHIIVGRGREYYSFMENDIITSNTLHLADRLEDLKLENDKASSKESTLKRLDDAKKRSGEIRKQRMKGPSYHSTREF